MTLTPTQNPWPSADFFPGEDKKILFALKTPKRYYFLENILFCPTKVGGRPGANAPLQSVTRVRRRYGFERSIRIKKKY